MPTSTPKYRHNDYPFVSTINASGYSAGSGFRFGFNGREMGKAVKETLNSVVFEARIYNKQNGMITIGAQQSIMRKNSAIETNKDNTCKNMPSSNGTNTGSSNSSGGNSGNQTQTIQN